MSRQTAGSTLGLLVLLIALTACGRAALADGGRTPTPTTSVVSVPAAPTTLPVPTAVPTMTPTTSVAPTTTPLPTPLPTLSVTAIPTRTPAPAATVTTVPGLLPRGPIPVGWRTYSSRTLSFAIAYPPDWTVDETQAAQKLIYFYAPVPDRSVFVVIGTTGAVEPNGNIDVLRDRWFAARTPDCVRSGLEETDRVTVAGSIFATLGTTCDYPDGLAYIFTGLGLRNQVPWIFEFNATYAVYDVALANAFAPMLQTLVIADPGSVR